MTRLIICLIALVAVLSSCSTRPDGVLSQEEMAQLLADIHTAEGVVESNGRGYSTDSAKRVLRQSVYARHGVSSEVVDSSLSWYGYNMEKYVEVYDRVIEILEERVELAQEKAGASTGTTTDMTITFEGDSVDVWTGVKYRRLAENMPADFITFNLSSDANWEKGDVYTLRGKFFDIKEPVEVTLAAEYADGTFDYVTRYFNGDGWHDAKIVLDSIKNARYVYGVAKYNPLKAQVAFVDSISLYRTRYNGTLRDMRDSQSHFSRRTKDKKEKDKVDGLRSEPPLPTVPAQMPMLKDRREDSRVKPSVRPPRRPTRPTPTLAPEPVEPTKVKK